MTKAKDKNAPLTGSEALYGFCGWLSTRKEVTQMGSSIDSSPIPPLIKSFCEANKLEDPGKDWSRWLKHPKE